MSSTDILEEKINSEENEKSNMNTEEKEEKEEIKFVYTVLYTASGNSEGSFKNVKMMQFNNTKLCLIGTFESIENAMSFTTRLLFKAIMFSKKQFIFKKLQEASYAVAFLGQHAEQKASPPVSD